MYSGNENGSKFYAKEFKRGNNYAADEIHYNCRVSLQFLLSLIELLCVETS